MDSKKYIPWVRPDFHGSEKEFVNNALESTWISGGYYVDKLEEDISDYIDSKYALTVSNGTTAIHIAYIALGLKPGDEIIMPGEISIMNIRSLDAADNEKLSSYKIEILILD